MEIFFVHDLFSISDFVQNLLLVRDFIQNLFIVRDFVHNMFIGRDFVRICSSLDLLLSDFNEEIPSVSEAATPLS